MIRRYGTGRLRDTSRRRREDVDPMRGLANMADVMLCLAVGIMMALIMHWNVDISSADNLQELKDAQNLSDKQVQNVEDKNGLKEKGVVYQDPKTHKYYIKIEN